MEHKYSRTGYGGLQNYHTCLQTVHAVNQLVEHGKDIVEMLVEHSGETIRSIRENLISCMIMVTPDKRYLGMIASQIVADISSSSKILLTESLGLGKKIW